MISRFYNTGIYFSAMPSQVGDIMLHNIYMYLYIYTYIYIAQALP